MSTPDHPETGLSTTRTEELLAEKLMPSGDVLIYIGASDTQVRWGSNDDPRGLLTEGASYAVKRREVHSWHTKIELVDYPGKFFNSVCFREGDTEELLAERRDRDLIAEAVREECAKVAMNAPLKECEDREYRGTDTYKCAALEISSAIRSLSIDSAREELERLRENDERLTAMLPLFEEARDALCAITTTAARLHNVRLDLADRMDDVGIPARWAARKVKP